MIYGKMVEKGGEKRWEIGLPKWLCEIKFIAKTTTDYAFRF